MTLRAKINETLIQRGLYKLEAEQLQRDLLAAQALRSDLDATLDIARKAAGLVQDSLATKLSGIVTKALTAVLEEPYEFVAEFVERRGVSECDLWIRRGKHKYDILKASGGGAADICSVCLQLAFIMMSDVARVLIVDEPARHLGAYQERFAQVLRDLCTELQFTIVAVTHADSFVEIADRVFTVTQKEGVSHVRAE